MSLFKGREIEAGKGPTGLSAHCDNCGQWIWLIDGAMLDVPRGELFCTRCAGIPAPAEPEPTEN